MLPNLANAHFISFQDEISALDSLHQAIHYYQIAIAQARPEIQTQIRIGLGKVYLGLMYYTDEVKNAQLAIECFEWVLEKSKVKEELRDATNGKSQGWWWRITFEKEHKPNDKELPFCTWAEDAAKSHRNDAVAVSYYALSRRWLLHASKLEETLSWFRLAWSLLQLRRQSPPPGFHYVYYLIAYNYYDKNKHEENGQIIDLPNLLSALEHIDLLISTITLKELYTIQRSVVNLSFMGFNSPNRSTGCRVGDGKHLSELILIISIQGNGSLGKEDPSPLS
jgi:tetratricopeptide (TPR) repeat protein